MNLQEMQLSHLVMLWQASDGNLPFKALVEAELQVRTAGNTTFSRESFFDICIMKNHAVTVFFIPTSNAYNLYGPNLTINIIVTEEEIMEMIQNYSSIPRINTSGQIRAKVLVKDRLTAEQIENASTNGFHTSEVWDVLHV